MSLLLIDLSRHLHIYSTETRCINQLTSNVLNIYTESRIYGSLRGQSKCGVVTSVTVNR